MKKVFNWMLMAALVVGLGWSVTACSDDDDKEMSEEERQQETKSQTDLFWDVVGQLTSMDNYTEDYKDKTFDPTIGEPTEGNPLVRIVATNDLETAALRFNNLTGSTITDGTTDYTWKDDAVGTLTWHKSTDGSSLATVDVNIKRMPKLQQIVYKTPDQMGTNGKFSGTAYYRFGDVIKRTYDDEDDNNKEKTEYWICVRPAFGPEGKEKSHWVSISPVPKKNIFEHNGSNDFKYALPKGLGTNKEQMQNFAEMLYAILHPDTWWSNIENQTKLKVFHDFNRDSLKYHNKHFWKRVETAWTNQNIWQTVFGMNRNQADDLTSGSGLFLLYKGYSWWTTFSWDATLYVANYTAQFNKDANMHSVVYGTYDMDMRDHQINIVTDYTLAHPYIDINYSVDGRRGHNFIIRHATGAELYDRGTPSTTESLATALNGIEDVYTYNNFYGIKSGRSTKPEVAVDFAPLETPRVGCLVGTDGKFYENKTVMDQLNVDPIAMVVWYDKSQKVEPATEWTGLAMSLEDCSQNDETRFKWATTKANADFANCSETASPQYFANNLMGLHRTKILKEHQCDTEHVHPAADIAWADAPAKNFSNWFLPSAGQWILAMRGMGYEWVEKNDEYTMKRDNGQWLWAKAGVPEAELNRNIGYWTTTEVPVAAGQNHSQVYIFYKEGIYLAVSKSSSFLVRRFVAFK